MTNPEIESKTAIRGELTLALGVDGSGKSTFLAGLASRLGTMVFEQTTSPEARRFKRANLGTPVTAAFVHQREDMFLRLNDGLEATISEELARGKDSATSGGRLITLVSHQLMRVVIDEAHPRTISQTVGEWLEDDGSLKPDRIVLTHAPHDVIEERIAQRQQAGDKTEAFVGFNALSFLRRYQDTWHDTLSILQTSSDIPCASFDSSQISPEKMIEQYANSFGIPIQPQEAP
jgi:thymidylate kinase